MSKRSKKEKRASHYKKEILKRGRRVQGSDGTVYVECPRTGTLVRGDFS